MITLQQFQEIVLSFPDTDQAVHFDLIAFRVHKKIFATLNLPEKRCTLKFNSLYQDIFTSMGKGRIYAVPNAWGKYGWTTIDLPDIDKTFLKDALLMAWRCTAPKKFEKIYPDYFRDE